MSHTIKPVRVAKPEGISEEAWDKARAALDASKARTFLALTDTAAHALDVAKGIHTARVRLAVQSATSGERAEGAVRDALAKARAMLATSEGDRAILSAAKAIGKAPKAEKSAEGDTAPTSEAPPADQHAAH